MHVHVTRWNLGLALVEGAIPGIQVDLVTQMRTAGVGNATDEVVEFWRAQILQRPIVSEDRATLRAFLDPFGAGTVSDEEIEQRVGLLVALLIDSPYFLWR
jgi:hypothetical protein